MNQWFLTTTISFKIYSGADHVKTKTRMEEGNFTQQDRNINTTRNKIVKARIE